MRIFHMVRACLDCGIGFVLRGPCSVRCESCQEIHKVEYQREYGPKWYQKNRGEIIAKYRQKTKGRRTSKSEIMQEVWKRPEHRSKMKESMNKARRRPGYGAKRSKISQEIWTRPGFRKKALDRLGQVQQWILMELISGRHIGKDGITRITTEDLYRDYYHIENDSKGGYKYYGKNYSQDIRQKVKSAYVRGHKSFDVLVEKGLIKKKWDFDGAYFTLTPAGRDRISSRVGQVDKHNFNVSVKEGENAESKA